MAITVLSSLAVACGACAPIAEMGDGAFPWPEGTIQAQVVSLTDVSAAAGLPVASTPCLVFRDLDGDGWADLLVAPLDAQAVFTGQMVVYLNDGAGGFRSRAIPVPLRNITACAAGDLDNDGLADLVLGGRRQGRTSVMALRNLGGGGFELRELPGLDLGDVESLSSLGLFDRDLDGFLDLYVGFHGNVQVGRVVGDCSAGADEFHCTAGDTQHPPSRLFTGDHRCGFSPVATLLPPLPAPSGYVNAVSFIDWNGDGRTDIFESVDFGRNRLLDGADFTDLLQAAPANGYNHGMGVAFGDFDGDGRWDAYVAETGPDQFLFLEPDGSVTNRIRDTGLVDVERFRVGWCPLTADLNADGWPDLFVNNSAVLETLDELTQASQGRPFTTRAQQLDYVVTNLGGRKFGVTPIEHRGKGARVDSATAAVADYDGDGRLDVAQVLFTDRPEVRLLHNSTPGSGHWLGVRLEGVTANRDAVGAVLVLHDGDTEIGRRAVGAGGAAASSETMHFGLGGRTEVPALTVIWPGGERQEVMGPIGVDRVIRVRQE